MPHMYNLHISYDEKTDRILLHSDKGVEPPHGQNRTEEVIRAYEKYMGIEPGMINKPERKAMVATERTRSTAMPPADWSCGDGLGKIEKHGIDAYRENQRQVREYYQKKARGA